MREMLRQEARRIESESLGEVSSNINYGRPRPREVSAPDSSNESRASRVCES